MSNNGEHFLSYMQDMRKYILFIIAVLVCACSANAQNVTVTGPKKPKTSVIKAKPRTTQRKSSAKRSPQRMTTKQESTISSPTGYDYGHGYVDLGLSVKWATCNIGADSPEEYGDYYAWGEASTKDNYTADTYSYNQQNIGSDISRTSYDVAHVKWGGSWRMPTKAEYEELENRSTWTWTTKGGHKGYKVKGPNGKSIFLPAAGYRCEAGLVYAGANGIYWSSAVYDSYYAWELGFYSSSPSVFSYFRYHGQSVRAVSE